MICMGKFYCQLKWQFKTQLSLDSQVEIAAQKQSTIVKTTKIVKFFEDK